MKFTFDEYFDWLIPWEGSVYENDPDDPGGATKFGIDQRSHPDVNIRNLTREQAKMIYFADYWLPCAGDKIPPRLAWALTDCAVNCGRTRGTQWLQSTLGVAVDGRIGPITIKAAKSNPDAWVKLLQRREAYYRALAKKGRFGKFLKGWLNRNNSLVKVLSR